MLEIILEVAVVAIIVGLQIRTFLRTRTEVARLAALYPPKDTLRVERRLVTPDGTVDLPDYAADAPADAYAVDIIRTDEVSADFREIVVDTNAYLRHNKGAAADFNILKDIAARQGQGPESAVQANVATPLYLGLLGTFLGVILGLVSIARRGVTDDTSLTPFLTGVLIAMVGSFMGLLLTLMGNTLLRNARQQRDYRQNQYFTFLQARLLPILHNDMSASLSTLKGVLDAFNQDFVGKVTLFEPILNTITENIRVQRDFLVKLEEIGFDRMAQANLAVFEKVRESAELFGQFTAYQQQLNQMLDKGAESGRVVGGILDRLTGFERGINNLGQYIGQHDNVIQRQLDFFQRHQTEMSNIAARSEQYFDEAALHLTELMRRRLEHHERDAQRAYEKWGEYFQKLNQDNAFERIMRQLDPLKDVKTNQEALARDVSATQRELLRKIELDGQVDAKLLEQLTMMNRILRVATAKNRWQRGMDKLFGGVKEQE
ncbi:hypothetical protein [Hymenobacter edaphi]|uniref:MotA/TolQ/ExbB proton channel domain-containing protein n=1 Tax=Hymenobacter edaphi TaxID=2211146 RepID=A0A328B9B0_9BACT|nr:hypothetical protein [Hymenobacter edaphi]RAK64010.1 hypothetical protein DLM85_18855 [Hymenobacter edaphi]